MMGDTVSIHSVIVGANTRHNHPEIVIIFYFLYHQFYTGFIFILEFGSLADFRERFSVLNIFESVTFPTEPVCECCQS